MSIGNDSALPIKIGMTETDIHTKQTPQEYLEISVTVWT